MKIAIASVGKNEDSEISSRGGRAPYFLFFDDKGIFLESLPNPFTVGGGGAGIAVAKMLSDMNIDSLVAGAIGEKMAAALDERGIKYYEKEGTAKAVIEELTA